jgi:hypothetical protein
MIKPICNLCDWSFRRLVLVWVGGILLEVLVFALPLMLAKKDEARIAQRIGSLKSSAHQKVPPGKENLTAAPRPSFITREGDSIYQMIPLARADSLAAGIPLRRPNRGVGLFVTLLLLGTIPMGLLILTAVWAFAQLIKRFMPNIISETLPH